METIVCPNCNYSIEDKNKPKKRNFTYYFLLLILFMLLTSVTTLIYIEYQYPEYGLKSRLSLAWSILNDDDLESKQNQYKNLNLEILQKKKELNLLNEGLTDLNKKIDELKEKYNKNKTK